MGSNPILSAKNRQAHAPAGFALRESMRGGHRTFAKRHRVHEKRFADV